MQNRLSAAIWMRFGSQCTSGDVSSSFRFLFAASTLFSIQTRNDCKHRLSQELRVAFKCSESSFSDFIAATETRALEYCGQVWSFSCSASFYYFWFDAVCYRYGKRYILTKNFSPDAFMQVAFQCAYRLPLLVC